MKWFETISDKNPSPFIARYLARFVVCPGLQYRLVVFDFDDHSRPTCDPGPFLLC